MRGGGRVRIIGRLACLASFLAGSSAHAQGPLLAGLERDAEAFQLSLLQRHPAAATDSERAQATARIERLRFVGDPNRLADAIEDRAAMRDADSRLWLDLAHAEMGRQPAAPHPAMDAAWLAQQNDDDAKQKAAAFGIIADALVALNRPDQAAEALRQAADAAPDDPGYRTRLVALSRAGGLKVRSVSIDADADPARACIAFNLPPSRRNDFHAEDWVTLQPAVKDAAITHEGDSLCIAGLPLARTVVATLREGMPGNDGLRLLHATAVPLAVGDRAPLLSFDSRMFLAPRGQAPKITLTSTNIASVTLRIAYYSERTIAPWIRENTLGKAIDGYVANQIDTDQARIVWSGKTDIPHYARNARQQTVLPLPADAMTLPGLYVVAVVPADGHPDYRAHAVQPLLQTDLAPTVWRGADGLTVQIRSYSDAKARAGVHLRLMARGNDILAETTTDRDGFASFAAPLTHGVGLMAPQSIQATATAGNEAGTIDFVSLDLDAAAFDLSGRGTAGLPQPGPVDGFVWTDRGIYRPGETVQLMGLLRDPSGRPVTLPTRFRIRRPNNQVFFEGRTEPTGDASVHLPVTLGNGASAGQWTAELLTDPALPPVGSASFKVDAFVPDRMAVTLGALPATLVPGTPVQVPVEARFLYGAPAAGLGGSATTTLDIADPPPVLAGYHVGLVDEQFAPAAIRSTLPTTDAQGRSTLSIALADAPDSTHPVQASLAVLVNDPSGHGTLAKATIPVKATGPMIGIKPDFTGSVDDGAEAGFDIAAIDPDQHRIALAAHMKLVREEPDWRLVIRGSLASFETVWHDVPVDQRDVAIPQAGTLHLGRKLGFGRYRLELAQTDGLAASSVRFEAGWGSSDNPDVPDDAVLSADRPRYTAGAVARVHVAAPFDGPATLLVLTDRVLSERQVAVSRSGSTFDVPIDAAWGPGAYVAVHAYKPGDGGTRPKRAIGLVWLSIDPAARHLDTRFVAPELARPGQVTHVRLHTAPGAWASVAAVDEGILRLTDFQTPDPSAHFLGRRRLGIDIRDDWGHLIAPASGDSALLRQGGDEAGSGKPSIPQIILSLFQKPAQADANGDIDVPLDLPDFAGQVRLMAVSWDGARLGSTSADLLVRDRMVGIPLLPRFLAPGDSARIGLLLQNLELPPGAVTWRLTADGPVTFEGATSQTLTLTKGAQATPTLTLRATGAGSATLHLALDGPDGFHARHDAVLTLRTSRARMTDVATTQLAAGATETVAPSAGADLPGTWNASASFGSAVRYDPAALLASLDSYPLFCLEQATSKGMPLTFAPQSYPGRAAKLQQMVADVLDRQRFDGGFGLWGSSDEAEPWLSGYATEFLLRARHAGAAVPETALRDALHYQADQLDRESDTPESRVVQAYALYDLALGGQGRIGAARVLYESLGTIPTPLARAQLAAALAIGNDRPRADAAFAAAQPDNRQYWSVDYGEVTRDTAALVVLMTENGVKQTRIATLIAHLPGADLKPDTLDTQQLSWLADAAYAAGGNASPVSLSVDGKPLPTAATISLPLTGPLTVRNTGDQPVWRSVSLTGVPVQPPPAARSGMHVSRRFFALDGTPLDLDHLAQNTEFVLLFEGRIDNADRAHQVSLLQGLAAGWEIAGRLGPGKVDGMDWLGSLSETRAMPSADDRYAAILALSQDKPDFRLAVRLRAVTVGSFGLPGAALSDMYQPGLFARQGSATIVVQPASP